MAHIDKMTLRGIRSFSPNREEMIEFYSPLTMIVGANGCGKTTIIESLKYCCTGSLPPGARNGQSFVNDPAVTDTSEVKANIKLKFHNRAGFEQVVTRSLQVTKKKSKLEFKALDGVVRSLNANNEKVSSTQKCSDLDRLVPEMLAVTAPILENVIFCHQEESSWPMQEGLVLKKKFDDIFESTRYAKALEALVKARKEYTDKAKDYKIELAELGAHVQGANDAKKELAACEANQEACDLDLTAAEEKISRLEDKVIKMIPTLYLLHCS
jgi:DNA repair protein RAD50